MTWTDERVELLKKLWADGLSASQIAAELGGVTRNAVIGKVHRLGLAGRAKSPSSAAPRPRKPRAAHMLRVPRPSIRGNTALMQAYEFDIEAEPAFAGSASVAADGTCTLIPLPDAAACTSACVDSAVCLSGACVGTARDCSDGDHRHLHHGPAASHRV